MSNRKLYKPNPKLETPPPYRATKCEVHDRYFDWEYQHRNKDVYAYRCRHCGDQLILEQRKDFMRRIQIKEASR